MNNTLNTIELELINSFQSHPLFETITDLPWPQFLDILIQRRFLSLSIVNQYEFVIDALADESMKVTVRSLLSEEYPRNTKGRPLPSHRELLFQDLLNLGATPEQILTQRETQETQSVRVASYQQLVSCLQSPYAQAGLIAFLRFWAEVLVSVEYTCLWEKMSERLSKSSTQDKARSEFYYFHMIHDNRRTDIGEESLLGGLTHSQELAVHLKQLIPSQPALDYVLTLEQAAYQLKYQFYNQFRSVA